METEHTRPEREAPAHGPHSRTQHAPASAETSVRTHQSAVRRWSSAHTRRRQTKRDRERAAAGEVDTRSAGRRGLHRAITLALTPNEEHDLASILTASFSILYGAERGVELIVDRVGFGQHFVVASCERWWPRRA
jgi:hypothetical protein